MRKSCWDLNYKAGLNDRTAINMLVAKLPELSFRNEHGNIVSKKRVSTTIRVFAKLSVTEQPHLLAKFFNSLGGHFYNLTMEQNFQGYIHDTMYISNYKEEGR